MEYTKVHILKWSGPRLSSSVLIGAVYADYGKACRIAEKTNKRRNIFHRILGEKLVVQSFDVR